MLGVKFVEYIHDDLVAMLWPGSDPIINGEYRNPEMIGSAVARPFHSAFGRDAYPTTIEKAVALFHSLIANHPFYNGNKRTAVIAIDSFLLANGYVLLLRNTHMYRVAQQTAAYKERGLSHDQSVKEIMDAIREAIVPLSTVKEDYKKSELPREKRLKALKFYLLAAAMRRRIRRNKLNKLVPAQE